MALLPIEQIRTNGSYWAQVTAARMSANERRVDVADGFAKRRLWIVTRQAAIETMERIAARPPSGCCLSDINVREWVGGCHSAQIPAERDREIAARLRIKEVTVKLHRSMLHKKLGAITSADVVRIAMEAGLSY